MISPPLTGPVDPAAMFAAFRARHPEVGDDIIRRARENLAHWKAHPAEWPKRATKDTTP